VLASQATRTRSQPSPQLSHIRRFSAIATGTPTTGEPSEERHPRVAPDECRRRSSRLAVAAVPLGAVIGLQPVLELAAGQYHWAKIVTAGWAVVCLLMPVDPAIGKSSKWSVT
jgi:hypothetical protein